MHVIRARHRLDELQLQVAKIADLKKKTLKKAEEIVKVTCVQPKKITLYTTPAWKRTVLKYGLRCCEGWKQDTGALMRESIVSPAVAPYKHNAHRSS
jgi:leucyl-tRNA synthetase